MRWLVVLAVMLAGAAQAEEACGTWRWCLVLAERFDLGIPPLPQDKDRAQVRRTAGVDLALDACERGDVNACATGLAVTRERPEGAAVGPAFRSAADRLCDQGYAGACLVGLGMRDRIAQQPRTAAARTLADTRYGTPCRAGDDAACLDWLRHSAQDLNLVGRDPAALRRLLNVCLTDRTADCDTLYGMIGLLGDVALKADLLSLIARSCDTGHGPACLALASLDDSRPRDDSLAAACKADDPDGCGAFGAVLFGRFRAGTGDLSVAADAWARGCELGHVPSCHYLTHLSRQ